jgi:hypothetical protein
MYPSPAPRSRCNAARMAWSIHKPTPRRCYRGIKLGECRAQGIEARGVGKPVFFGPFRPASRAAPASTATATATAAPGVVLRVADGIVRIVVHVVAGEDLGGRLR